MVPSTRYHASASRVCTCRGLPAPGGCVTSEAASSPAVSPAPTRRSNNAPIAQVAAPEPAATASGAAPVLVVVSEAVGVCDTGSHLRRKYYRMNLESLGAITPSRVRVRFLTVVPSPSYGLHVHPITLRTKLRAPQDMRERPS